MAGFPNPEERHFPQYSPSTHFGNDSGCMTVLLDFDGEAAPLHQEQGGGDIALFNEHGFRIRVEKLGAELLLMGLEQISQPAIERFQPLCCGIHCGQATTLILIGSGLIP